MMKMMLMQRVVVGERRAERAAAPLIPAVPPHPHPLPPGDREAAGGGERDHDEGGRPGEAAPAERQGPTADPGERRKMIHCC